MKKYEGYYLRQFNNLCKLKPSTTKRGKVAYFDEFITLDTETSHLPYNYDEQGRVIKEDVLTWVYQWATCTDNAIYNGRNCEELVTYYNNLIETNEINENVRLVTYIHNASYDLSYLFPYFNKEWGLPKIIATASHKVISATYNNGLVFKCSYKLSNQSLEKWSENFNTLHKKLVGFVDYSKIRYSDSKLTQNDFYYMWNDVIVLRECLLAQFKSYGHTVATTPLTSTGYIRELAYNSFRQYIKVHGNKERENFMRSALNSTTYKLLKEEMSGGITHGNRFIANRTIRPKKGYYFKHRDFDSHYPTSQLWYENYYPVGKFNLYYTFKKDVLLDIRDVFKLTENYCVLVKIIIKDLRLKDRFTPLPYAQSSHFEKCKSEGTTFIKDNGRILKYDGICEVVVNEIDLKWLIKQYKFDYVIKEVYIAKKDKLPQWLTDVIKDLYKKKTDYKNAIKNAKKQGLDTFDMEVELLRIKALLNSVYGMTASSIVRDSFDVDIEGNWKCNGETKQDIGELIARYYKGKKNCMRFEWGCWCTSYARNELMTFYETIYNYSKKDPNVMFCYCDTDSIFYISCDELENIINGINNDFEKRAIDNECYVKLDNGKIKTFNRFDDENDDIRAFKFLHAKCYAVLCGDDEKLECTVAGVPKRILTDKGYYYREDELQSIDNLQENFVFRVCGGSECRYFNFKPNQVIHDGHIIVTGGGAIISNTTKTLSDLDIYTI